MTSRSEQLSAQFTSQFTAPLSAFGKSQLEAQLGFLQAFGDRAIESAGQLISLNLRASRTSVEQATGTFKQLLDATSPREVIAAGSRAQGQWHYLFEYGRELLSIASGAPIQAWSTQPSPLFPTLQLTVARAQAGADDAAHATADAVSTTSASASATASAAASVAAAPVAAAADVVSQVLDQVSIATAEATTVTTEIASAAADVAEREVAAAAIETAETAADIVDDGSASVAQAAQAVDEKADETVQKFEAAVEAAIADDAPPAKETLLVQALNEAAPKPAGAEHPIASTIALEAHDHVELPAVTPVDAKPPVHTPVPPPSGDKRRSPRARK